MPQSTNSFTIWFSANLFCLCFLCLSEVFLLLNYNTHKTILQTITEKGGNQIHVPVYHRNHLNNYSNSRAHLLGTSTNLSVKPHQNRGSEQNRLKSPQITSITAGRANFTCAWMTLPYWLKVRVSVPSVVSHDSPPTKIRPTFSSAIPGQIKIPSPPPAPEHVNQKSQRKNAKFRRIESR